ncbi:UDP-2,3-diacylglucosamine diphosphatase LpxI [Desulfovibrio mangrovi]|uniref:LpxI family protein n=1 Tax=Desulfovibrio mangrovi TaxID=2976983 RepID=UPI0022451800|nr:UDP-2,3-diacylglucosamine diphosphatase LpxI [Desulfovibrio mangrovi]UZP68888.1 UDP-2,3-diacylglucosamine diphosphatase LpxI [Desulfovibrio mangrovi]
MTKEAIGIVAGKGQFPALVARGARAAGLDVVMCGFHGHTDPLLEREADSFAMLHLGALNKLIEYFKERGVRRLCFAGAISKPKALDLRPDFRAAKVLFKLRSKGDDVLLRAVMDELESEGLRIVQAAELVPDLRGAAGVQTRRQPGSEEWDDLRYGWPIAQAIGAMDIGQCIVVKRGMVVAVEGLEGTDALLRRGAELGGAGCVAIKIVKPGQDERIDLPALGTATIRTLVDGGYSCLAYHAGKTLFFDREEALKLADAHNLSIIGLDEEFGKA